MLTSAPLTDFQSVCTGESITPITYSTAGLTSVSVNGLPPGLSYSYDGETITISGTADTYPGTINWYWISGTGSCGTTGVTWGAITVVPMFTLTSGPGTDYQMVCSNSPITPITFETEGIISVEFFGLPPGVSGSFIDGEVTISGTPLVGTGTFSFIIMGTGSCPNSTYYYGLIMVGQELTLISAPGTDNQTVCYGSPIISINYSATGITSVSASGLPPGVSYSLINNTVYISGTPTFTGVYNYSLTGSGPCGIFTVTGTIKVAPHFLLTSDPGTLYQSVYEGAPLTPITFEMVGGILSASVTGLPPGLGGSYLGDIVTIYGTPVVSGAFPVSLIGSNLCGTISHGFTITIGENNLPMTQLNDASCGVTVSDFHHVLRANAMTGATYYEFEFNDGTNTYYELRPNRGFYFSLFTWPTYSTTYQVRVRWYDGSTWSCWGPMCTVTTPPHPVTWLDAASCGATATTPAHLFQAIPMAGATQYEFEFSDGVNTYYELRPNQAFYFGLFSWDLFNATYTVRVRWFSGVNWSAWGPPCSLTNSPSATTQLDAASCGVTATSPAHVFRAIAMPGATQYEFEFSDGVNTYYELRPNRGFYFSLFTWDQFSTTYTVKVRWYDGTMWSPWGPPCNVTTSPMPTTQLQAGDCGATVTSAAQVLRANAMAGADQYEFKLSDGINTSYLLRPNSGMYFLLFGLPPGTFGFGIHLMQVRWRDAGTGIWSAWGPSCPLFLPEPLTMEAGSVTEEWFEVQAFPVPFGDVVNLTVETTQSAPVHVTVTDVNGRVVEDRRVQMEHNGLLTMGESWSNGVYMIRVQQGAELRTLRVVKAQQ